MVIADDNSPLTETQLQHYADRVNTLLTRMSKDSMSIGKLLIEAKAKAAHGDFERLFYDYKGPGGPVPNPIPISHNYADTFMRVARHPVLSKRGNSPHLPLAHRTLLVLAKAPKKLHTKIQQGLDDGRLTRTTSTAEARDFLREAKPQVVNDEAAAKAEIRTMALAFARKLFERFPTLRTYIVEAMTEILANLIEELPNQEEVIAEEVSLVVPMRPAPMWEEEPGYVPDFQPQGRGFVPPPNEEEPAPRLEGAEPAMSSRTPKQRREHKRLIDEMLADLHRWATEADPETPDVHAVVNPNHVYGGGWLIRAFLGESFNGGPRRIGLVCTRLDAAIAEWRQRKKEREEEARRRQEIAERN